MPWWIQQNWFFFVLFFFGIIAVFTLLRRRDRNLLKTRFPGLEPVVQSFGIKFYGLQNSPNAPKPEPGFLVLFFDRLYFQSPRKKIELEIPVENIRESTHDTVFKNRDFYQTLIIIHFTDENGIQDQAAFRVPYPNQWLNAVDHAKKRIITIHNG